MVQNSPSTTQVQIRNFVVDSSTFESEQEVATKSWHLPTHTIENLRSFIVGEYGTTQHTGAFCTRAMRNWMQETPSDDMHKTWGHLKNDYNYNEDVSNWNYRQYHDYTEMDKDNKTALGFSAPTSTIEAFTSDLSKNEYGSELANAVEAELLKEAQIAQMQALINGDDAWRKVEEEPAQATAHKVQVDDEGNITDLSNISLETNVELTQGDIYEYTQNNEIEWENRRGLLASIARSRKATPKNFIYSVDEMSFDVETNRSKRKDFNALIEQAENDSEPLCVAPAKIVMEKMNVKQKLESKAGLTGRRQPLTFDVDENFSEFKLILYNSDKITNTEMWKQFGQAVCDIGYQLSEVEWNVKDTVTAVYKGVHYKNALQKYLPVIHTAQDVLEDVDDDELTALKSRMDVVVEALENALAEVTNHTIGAGSKCLEETYNQFKEGGETPTSIEFDAKGRLKQGQGFEA